MQAEEDLLVWDTSLPTLVCRSWSGRMGGRWGCTRTERWDCSGDIAHAWLRSGEKKTS